MLRVLFKKIAGKILYKHLLLFLLLGFPIYFPLMSLKGGVIPHWYDTAWALLLGLENHQKIRLIGYEGGIPGIFYGPHWSWLLSLVQLFSKNPVVITTVVLFIPYFTFLPFLLYKFKSVFGGLIVALLWLSYILAYYPLSVHLWHVHLAPLIFLALLYLLISINWFDLKLIDICKIFLSGFLLSFLVFIHMSFGATQTIATTLFISISLGIFAYQSKQQINHKVFRIITALIAYGTGFLLCSTPFILFELRHDFRQTKAIIFVLTQSILYNSAVVGQLGLSKTEIWQEFLLLPLTILQLPGKTLIPFWVFIIFMVGYFYGKRQFHFTLLQKRLVTLLSLSTFVMLTIYLTSKNPIWKYHFIGAEISVLLFMGILAAKSRILTLLLFVWVVWISTSTLVRTITIPAPDPMSLSTLNAKQFVVESIYKNAQNQPFAVYTYSSAIMTYDYDYLFAWLGKDKYSYVPGNDPNSNLVYLIIPEATDTLVSNFTNDKTPSSQFETADKWKIANGTVVMKRVKKL
ncbi:MAG: hypothetical protein AAB874_01720 [Patescibacteria group bacterium]|mgnify:CR=1 FL=1